MDASKNYPLHLPNQFELYDFIDDPNFDQFIDLIRGETEDAIAGYDNGLTDGSFVGDRQISSIPGDTFGFDASRTIVSDPNSVFDPLEGFYGEMMNDGEEDNDEEHSSATTTATATATATTSTTTTKKARVDRSRTLISERRRRGRMKEKLYALRSLMDKASIIGDAVLYVQDLQKQAKKLKAEIAGLETTLGGAERYQESVDNPVKFAVASHPICKKIMQLDMFQVEEGGFYVRLICNKGEGVAISLYKALESLTNFKLQTSNLATASDRYVLTFTLISRDCEQAMNLPNLKLWVSGALVNQGFEFTSPLSS
ncbi:hypothetical protein V6N13_145231 [Hibiscus sabdariffa]|uniref:Uncharacterized protein n=2 Tax=Hibiscus sabdariffa TaxID=183260 RepID=A0ABR2FNF7_9ROSI